MEVEDELIDELSMSILEPGAVIPAVAEGSDGAEFQEVGDVTITVNTRGEVVDVDQDSLNTVLGSGQQSARVTFVRVDDGGQSTIESQIQLDSSELLAAYGQTDGGAETDPAVNMGMVLNPDQMKSIEEVLDSDAGRNLLNVEETEVNVEAKVENQTPTRRSQRQVDRETRQTAEKIRAENQESMRREEAGKGGGGGEGGGGLRGRGKGGMMRGGSRTARSRKHPKTPKSEEKTKSDDKMEVEESEEEKEEENDDDENDSDSGSWVSEDDPDRLWCICQKPHNNRFMICCDTCLDWFHGICVGITKAQGKEMEMAGKDWKCPQCLQGISRSAAQSATADRSKTEPANASNDIEELLNDDLEDEFLSTVDSLSKGDQPTEKPRLRRKSSSALEEPDKKREKGPTCHMCSNPPQSGSIYCSDSCIAAHATQALSVLGKDGKSSKPSSPVVVLEPRTNTLINGHRAPTEATLKSWLQSHKTFHVVLPSKKSLSSKSQSQSSQSSSNAVKDKSGPKIIPAHREATDKKAQKIEDIIKKRPMKSREEMVAETKAALRRSVSSQDSIRSSSKRERRSSESDRRPTPVKRKPVEKPIVDYEYKEMKSSDNSALRSTVVKGVRDALLEKLKKSDLKIEDRKVTKIAEEIEIAMFGTFGEVGSKYKNKYRSLTYNIKDPKNDGLFRRILLKDLQPIEMSADEYASKELQQWRKAAAQKDLEAIKSHELDRIALGNTFVMKSHKGEQVIEKSDELVSSSSGPATLALLPEEQEAVKESGPSKEMTLEDSEKKKERRHKDKHRERQSSGKSHSHSSKDKKHSRDRDKSSHRSSSEKDRKHSSKSHSSSSKNKKDKSRDKERSSKSSGEKKEASSSKSPSSIVPPVMAEPSMSDLQAKISRANAAIEAAKKSQSAAESLSHRQTEDEPEVGSESPLDLDLPCDGGWVEGEVSSTVIIPTPDQPESWSGNTAGEPSVWEGQVIMQDVAKFSVSAFQVSGTSDYLSVDLKSSLELVGRIPPSVCWDYIDKIGKNPTKEILVLKLGPSNNDEQENYQTFFQYLNSRERFGVVGNCNDKSVKDCYIMPLKASQPVPEGLLPMSGQGLPLPRPDLLLTIIVRTKRTRVGEVKQPTVSRTVSGGLPVLPVLPSVTRGLPPAPPPVRPAEDGSSPYSPASSSPEILSGPSQTAQPGDSDGFSEQLARLQREVAEKRAKLAQREQQQQGRPEAVFSSDLPMVTPAAPPPFLPPRVGPGASTLSRMSADDLVAAAAAMEQPSPSKQSLPPPGPGMPGNLLGQGVGNIDMVREEQYGGGWDRPGGYRGAYRGRGGPGFVDRRGRGGGWGDRRGRGGWDRGRDYGDRRDDRDGRGRDRRDDRGGWRERDRWGADSYRRDRRDYDRREPRDYRERERSRPRHDSRRYEETERPRGGRENFSSLGTEDWSDDEFRMDSENSQNTSSLHMNVAEEIANFDKQFLPNSGN